MILHIDIPIIVSQIPPDLADALPGALYVVQTGEQVVDGVTRCYYAGHPPLRLLLVNRSGLGVASLANASVNAVVGWDSGESPYTLPENGRKQHSKITIFDMLSGPASPQTSLAALIPGIPRSDRPGGRRPGAGRPLTAGSPTRPYSITISQRLASWLTRLGAGNLSAGVRHAAEQAGFRPEDEP